MQFVEIGEAAVPYRIRRPFYMMSSGIDLHAPSLFSSFATVKGVLIDGGFCEDTPEAEGQIVLCQRGENYFVEKVQVVQEGGGEGVIIYNNAEGVLFATLGDDADVQIPAVSITLRGEVLLKRHAEEVLL